MKRRHDTPIAATLSGLADRFGGHGPTRALGDDRLDGATCLVTGATRGLGKAVAEELLRRRAKVIVASRSDLDEAGRSLRTAVPGGEVETERVDLADLATVHALADRLRGRTVDVAIMNAAIVAREARRTAQDLEQMFQVNFLANAVLLERLLSDGTIPNRMFADPPASSSSERRPRIVLVSSESHRTAAGLNPSSLGRFEPYSMTGSMAVYSTSKLLLTVWGMELARRLEGDVSVHALCPGPVNTSLARESPAWVKPVLYPVMRLLFRSPDRAAEPVVYLAASKEIENETGLYLHLMRDRDPAPAALDPTLGAELWEATRKLADRYLPA